MPLSNLKAHNERTAIVQKIQHYHEEKGFSLEKTAEAINRQYRVEITKNDVNQLKKKAYELGDNMKILKMPGGKTVPIDLKNRTSLESVTLLVERASQTTVENFELEGHLNPVDIATLDKLADVQRKLLNNERERRLLDDDTEEREEKRKSEAEKQAKAEQKREEENQKLKAQREIEAEELEENNERLNAAIAQLLDAVRDNLPGQADEDKIQALKSILVSSGNYDMIDELIENVDEGWKVAILDCFWFDDENEEHSGGQELRAIFKDLGIFERIEWEGIDRTVAREKRKAGQAQKR